jgi:hypothetical protein
MKTTNGSYLTCCVCGADAGCWQQHWNRDTGYGICAPCAQEQSQREIPERMASLYGLPDVNYEGPSAAGTGSDSVAKTDVHVAPSILDARGT